MKKIYISILAGLLLISSSALALTKPSPDADLDSLSYVFYLYYDNGQLFADRDYTIKFDIVSEKFIATSTAPGMYRLDLFNFKSEIVKTISFDPRQDNSSLTKGKIQVRAPYVADALRASFYDGQNRSLLTIFVNEGSLCNGDGFCNAAGGETSKTCPSDCKSSTPRASVVPPVILDEGPDLTMILIYAVGGLGVVVGVWLGWKWWKKKKEESFLPPPSAPTPPMAPPIPPSGL